MSHSEPFQNLLLNPGRKAIEKLSGFGYPSEQVNHIASVQAVMSAIPQEALAVQSSTSDRVTWERFSNDPHGENNCFYQPLINSQLAHHAPTESSSENAAGLPHTFSDETSRNIYDFPSVQTVPSVPLPTPLEWHQAGGNINVMNRDPSLASTETNFRETTRDRNSIFGLGAADSTDMLGNPPLLSQPSTQNQPYISSHQHYGFPQQVSRPLYRQQRTDMDPATQESFATEYWYPNVPTHHIHAGMPTQMPVTITSQPFISPANPLQWAPLPHPPAAVRYSMPRRDPPSIFQGRLSIPFPSEPTPTLRYPRPSYCNSNSNAMNRAVSQPVSWAQRPTKFNPSHNDTAVAACRAGQNTASHLAIGDRLYMTPSGIPLHRLNRGAFVPSVNRRSQALHQESRNACHRTSDAHMAPRTTFASLEPLPQPSELGGRVRACQLAEKRRRAVRTPLSSSAVLMNRRIAVAGHPNSARNKPPGASPEQSTVIGMAELTSHRPTRRTDSGCLSYSNSSATAKHVSSHPTEALPTTPKPTTPRKRRLDDEDDEAEVTESELLPKPRKKRARRSRKAHIPVRSSRESFNGWSFTGECEPRDDPRRRKALKYSLFKEHSESRRKLGVNLFIRCQYPHVDRPAEPCLALVECEASDPGRYLKHLRDVHQIKKEDTPTPGSGKGTSRRNQLESKNAKTGKEAVEKENNTEHENSNEKESIKRKYICRCLIPVGEPRVEVDEHQDVIFIYDTFTQCTSTLCDDSAFQEHLYHGMHRLQGIEEVLLEDGRAYRIGLKDMYKIGCPGCPKINDRHFGASCDNLKKHIISHEKCGCSAMTIINREWDQLPAKMRLL